MVGPTDVVQPWMPRARESDAWLFHVSLVGGRGRSPVASPLGETGAPRMRRSRRTGILQRAPRLGREQPGRPRARHVARAERAEAPRQLGRLGDADARAGEIRQPLA